MLAVEFLGAKDVAQRDYVGVLDLLPGVDDLNASLIHISKADDALEIVETVGFDVSRSVADCLVGERSRLMLDVDLLIIERNQVVILLDLVWNF